MQPRKYLMIGAHPDDPDILFAGTALKLLRAGHIVKFVSVTNGDSGHYSMDRAELAALRAGEAAEAGKIAGIAGYEVMDIHDAELEPSVANRKKLLRVIRQFDPDVVISHRTCDYHPDHRATGQLVLDCAYLLQVPLVCPEIPISDKVPIFAYSYDRFTHPAPLRPDAAVEIDSVYEEKCRIMACHRSQYFDWLPFNSGIRNCNASGFSWPEKVEWLGRWMNRFRDAADLGRDTLAAVYGEEKGRTVKYAEVFEQSDYSRTVPPEEFRRLFEVG